MQNSSGLTFSNLVYSVNDTTSPGPFSINNSSNINLTGLQVHDNNQSTTAYGISITGSTNVSVTNSSFSYLDDALKLSNNNGITITGNTFSNITSDGIDGGGSSNVLISNNLFTDFHPVTGGEHPDAIQMWTTGETTSASNITIENNAFVRGAGSAIQGVNIEDEVGNLPYLNVNISNNLTIGALAEGIYLQDAVNASVANNQVYGFSDTTSYISVFQAINAAVSGNTASAYQYTSPDFTADVGLTQSNNATTPTVYDGGAAALQAWLASNPQVAANLTSDLQLLLAPLATGATSFTGPAFDVSAKFDALNAATKVSSIVISDNGAINLSASQLASDTRALSVLSNANGTPYSIAVGDTAANIAANIDALNANSHISSIVIADYAWVNLTAAQATNDGAALAKLQTPSIQAPTVTVQDTAAHVQAYLTQLNALAANGTIVHVGLTDTKTLNLTADQGAADATVLGLLSNMNVVVADSAANITANLQGLIADSALSSITVTGGGTIAVSASVFATDASILSKIAGVHDVEVLGYGGNASAAELYSYNASGSLLNSSSLAISQTGSGGATISAESLAAAPTGNFLGDRVSDVLIENTGGIVDVGQLASNGALAYSQVGGLGSSWKFDGVGDYLGDGQSQFLIESTNGSVVVGAVGAGAKAAYTQVAQLGSEWSLVGSGDFLAEGRDQFLIESSSGAVDVGTVGSNGQATFTQVSALGSEWRVLGSGDFTGDGRTQFLIESTNGAVDLGEVGSNGQATYTQVGALGSEWTFEGFGDFLGDGQSQFLIESTSGAVVVGQLGSNGKATYTQVAALGSEWKFVGAGDYSGTGGASFLIESTSGALVSGTVVNGKAQYAQVSGLGAEWSFRG